MSLRMMCQVFLVGVIPGERPQPPEDRDHRPPNAPPDARPVGVHVLLSCGR